MNGTMMTHEHDPLAAQHLGHELAFRVGSQRRIVLPVRDVVHEEGRVVVVHAKRRARRAEDRLVEPVRVDHAVHVRTGTVDGGMEVDAGRRGKRAPFTDGEVEADDTHVPGKRLVEVLVRRDVERVLTGDPHAHVAADLTVEALAVKDPTGCGDAEARIRLRHAHHTKARKIVGYDGCDGNVRHVLSFCARGERPS